MNEKYVANNICEGCLCKDRITRVQSDDLLQIYSQLLGKQVGKRPNINVEIKDYMYPNLIKNVFYEPQVPTFV